MNIHRFGFTTNNPNSLEGLCEVFEERGISYEKKEHRDKSISLFIRVPNGNKIQIVYLPDDMYYRK